MHGLPDRDDFTRGCALVLLHIGPRLFLLAHCGLLVCNLRGGVVQRRLRLLLRAMRARYGCGGCGCAIVPELPCEHVRARRLYGVRSMPEWFDL